MKLSWHPTHKLWCKIIGKRITQDGTRLIQAQHYFCSERDTSETAAASLKEQWRHLKRTWKRDHEPDLLALGEPFPTIPHWYKIAPVNAKDRLRLLDLWFNLGMERTA